MLAPLLAQVGPRLRQLELFSMAAWFPSVYQLLPSWTALESLSLRIASDYLVVPVVSEFIDQVLAEEVSPFKMWPAAVRT